MKATVIIFLALALGLGCQPQSKTQPTPNPPAKRPQIITKPSTQKKVSKKPKAKRVADKLPKWAKYARIFHNIDYSKPETGQYRKIWSHSYGDHLLQAYKPPNMGEQLIIQLNTTPTPQIIQWANQHRAILLLPCDEYVPKALKRLKCLRKKEAYEEEAPIALPHEKIISQLNQLEHLDLSGYVLKNTQHLENLTQLRFLSLPNQQLRDKQLRFLKKLNKLRALNLYNNQLTGKGLQYLHPEAPLAALDISSNKVTAKNLQYILAKRADLTYLKINQNQLKVSDYKTLSRLQKLRYLHFHHKDLQGALKWIGRMTSLRVLIWASGGWKNTGLSDEHLQQLKPLVNLTRFRCRGCQITNDGLAHLAPMKNLVELWLPKAQITNKGLVLLKQFPKLKSLNLTENTLSDQALQPIASLPELQHLHLSETQITDEGLVLFKNHKKLKTLNVSKTNITDQSIETIKTISNLETLYVGECKITKASIPKLKGIKTIKKLHICGAPFTTEDMNPFCGKPIEDKPVEHY